MGKVAIKVSNEELKVINDCLNRQLIAVNKTVWEDKDVEMEKIRKVKRVLKNYSWDTFQPLFPVEKVHAQVQGR